MFLYFLYFVSCFMSSCFVKIYEGLNVIVVINYLMYFRSMYFHLEFF